MADSNPKWGPLRRFRAVFHQLRDIYEECLADGGLELSVFFQDHKATIIHQVPGGNEALRFAQLLAIFAHPKEDLFFPAMVNDFIDTAPLSSEQADELRSHSKSVINSSSLAFIIDKKQLTGPEIFEIVADGGVLSEEPDQVKKFEFLVTLPMAKDAIFFAFHSYCQEVSGLLEHIYVLAKEIEANGTNITPEKPALASHRCIYCLATEGQFSTIEHVFPESLGNHDLILPIGTVCDQCNKSTLSDRDKYLVESDPINFLRLFFVPGIRRLGATSRLYLNA